MKVIKNIGKYLLHLVAIGIIAFSFSPVINWYITHIPIMGVDFFNTVTFADYFSKNIQLMPSSYLYFWYSGSPVIQNVVFFWFQLAGLMVRFMPLLESVKYLMMGSFLLLLLFTYAACYRLSRQHLLSAVISGLVGYSVNMYGSLIWGGSLPYFANQLFFPMVIWLMINYLNSGNKRWYWLTILATGVSLLGHMVNAGSFVIPVVLLMIFFGWRKIYISVKKRIYESVVYISLSLLMSFRLTYRIFESLFQSLKSGNIGNLFGFGRSSLYDFRPAEGGQVDPAILAFEHNRPNLLFSDTSIWLFYLFGVSVIIFIIALLIGKDRRRLWEVLLWVIMAVYSVAYIYLNSYGVSFLLQGWYRSYWHFPITLGLASAAMVGYGLDAINRRVKLLKHFFAICISIIAIVGLGQTYTNQLDSFFLQMDIRGSTSSSHPQILNLVKNQAELNDLKIKLVPSWINPDDRNNQIFISDQLINIWWNSLFNKPLTRGYLDPVTGSYYLGNNFLLEQAIEGDGLIKNFKYSENTARNMAHYYIDWYGIKYFAGGHASQMKALPLSSYLENDIELTEEIKTKGRYSIYDNPPGRPQIYYDSQNLIFYSFKDELTSSILTTTQAPVALFIGDWIGYESLTKILGMNNINSQKLITVFTENQLDFYSYNDFSKFDVIILSNYKYQNKYRVFNDLLKYITNGGKVLIDSGSEIRDAVSDDLPEIFPFKTSQRKALGKTWDLKYDNGNELFSGVNINNFDPPIFDKFEWKISFPADQVKPNADVLLSQGDHPILIYQQIGKGKIIWSGINLAYHVHYYNNVNESILYLNLLSSLISLGNKNQIKLGNSEFISPQEARISINEQVKGVLYKTQIFNNWEVKIDGKNAKTYKAGPTYPGFIYVPIDNKKAGAVTFKYIGKINDYLVWIISWLITLILLDLSFLRGRLISNKIKTVKQKLHFHIGKWWEKEEY